MLGLQLHIWTDSRSKLIRNAQGNLDMRLVEAQAADDFPQAMKQVATRGNVSSDIVRILLSDSCIEQDEAECYQVVRI